MSLFWMPPNRVSTVTSDVFKSGPRLWLDFLWWRGNEIYYDHRTCWTMPPLARQRYAIAVLVVCMIIGATAVGYRYRSDASIYIRYRQIQKFGRNPIVHQSHVVVVCPHPSATFLPLSSLLAKNMVVHLVLDWAGCLTWLFPGRSRQEHTHLRR